MGIYFEISWYFLQGNCTRSSYQIVYRPQPILQASYVYYLSLWPSFMKYWYFAIVLQFSHNYSRPSHHGNIFSYWLHCLLFGLIWDVHKRTSTLFPGLQLLYGIYYMNFFVIMQFLSLFWSSNIILILFGYIFIYLGLFPCTWRFRIFQLHYHYGILINYYFGSLTDLSYLLATWIYIGLFLCRLEILSQLFYFLFICSIWTFNGPSYLHLVNFFWFSWLFRSSYLLGAQFIIIYYSITFNSTPMFYILLKRIV